MEKKEILGYGEGNYFLGSGNTGHRIDFVISSFDISFNRGQNSEESFLFYSLFHGNHIIRRDLVFPRILMGLFMNCINS